MNKYQIDVVEEKLKTEGMVTRNWCLDRRPNITRLSSIIHRLNRDGWEIDGKARGNDYVYSVIKSPYKKFVYRTPDGREITTYERK